MSIGAFVRASESGLGCPDWPSCHGRLLAGGHHAMIEEVHRWIATVLIVGVVGLAVGVFRGYRGDRRLTHPMVGARPTRAPGRPRWDDRVAEERLVDRRHPLRGGRSAVAALTLVAVRLAFPAMQAPARDGFSAAVGWFVGLSFGLLLAGSTVANTDSHTACGHGFPLCNGSLFPSLDHHMVINLVHRTWAGAMLLFALWIFWRSRRDRAGVGPVQLAASVVAGLYMVQAVLGIVVVAVGENDAVEIIHSSLASLTWAVLATLLALTRTLPARTHRIHRHEIIRVVPRARDRQIAAGRSRLR